MNLFTTFAKISDLFYRLVIMAATTTTQTSMWTIALLVILIMAVGVMGYNYYSSLSYGSELKSATISRGMNGIAGQTINLTCPSGTVIDFTNPNPTTTRGAIVCTGTSGCDAFWSAAGQMGNFYTANIVDVFATNSPFTDLASLAGKNSGSWTIPTSSDTRIPSGSCLRNCQKPLQFIGTYDCIPQ